MKKILFFTSILFFTLTTQLFSQHPINSLQSNITDTSAYLSWDADTCTGVVNLQYRSSGTTWGSGGTINTNVSSPYFLTGLIANTGYEWRVKCSGVPNWSLALGFTTVSAATLPIDTVEVLPILCHGASVDVIARITQTTPTATNVQFINYQFSPVLSSIVLPFGATPIPATGTFSTKTFNNIPAGDYLMLVVDSTLFADATELLSSLQRSVFVQDLNDPSILGYYYYSIDEPAQLAVTTSPVDPNLCALECNATEELTITGGTQPYNYTLNGATVNLGPQSHTINTAAGMTFSPDSLTINVGDTVTWNNTGGSHNVNATLATFPLNPEGFGNVIGTGWTFKWVFTIAGAYNYQCDPHAPGMSGVIIVKSTPANTSIDTLTNLCEGGTGTIYNLEVSDVNGCSTSPLLTAVTIATIAPIVPGATLLQYASGDNISCSGENDGEITASATGGAGGFTYSKDLGATYQTPPFPGLTAGTYTITYKDANDCTADTTVTLIEPPNLSGNLSVTDSVSCNEISDGKITFEVDLTSNPGAGAPYQYSLDNGVFYQFTNVFPNLVGDSLYEVKVRDINTCQYTSTVYLVDPLPISHLATISSNYNGWAVRCNGYNDGEITASATGGTGAITYSTDGANFYPSPLTLLSAGSYTITYKDANNCIAIESSPLTLNEPVSFSIDTTGGITNATCPGAPPPVSEILNPGPYEDGKIQVTPINGVGAISYSIFPSSSQLSPDFLGLAAGGYSVTATDDNGCIANVNNITISEPDPFAGGTLVTSEPDYCSPSTTGGNIAPNGTAAIDNPASITGGTGTYSYKWSDPLEQTTSTATGLFANNYHVIISDGEGCKFRRPLPNGASPGEIVVGSTPVFSLNLAATTTCTGEDNGEVTVTATTAAGALINPSALDYQWTDINGAAVPAVNGGTSDMIYDLPIGTYSVEVTEVGSGCIQEESESILASAFAVFLDSTIVTNSSCYGINDAQVEMFASGGIPTSDLIYSCTGFADQIDDPLFDTLSPGTYTLSVTDGSCTADTVITLFYTAELDIVSTIVNDESCFGANDGYIQAINVQGGTAPYEYSVNGSNNYPNVGYFTGYSPGTYTVEVTDVNNCVTQDYMTIDDAVLLEVDVIASDWNNYQIRCHGDSSGYANIVVSGGTGPGTYSKYCYDDNNGVSIPTSNNPTVSELDTGIYTFKVIDANGCTYSETIIYNEPDTITHNFIGLLGSTPEHVTCSGWSNGSLVDSVSGGVGTATSYIYQWNTGETTYSLTGIPIGTYIMTVRDENNCMNVDSFTIHDNNALIASASATDVSCYDDCDGVIITIVVGGSPDIDANGNPVYYYQWDDVLLQTTDTAVGLCADNITTTDYSCVITDNQGCEVTTYATINQQPDSLSVSATVTSDISCYGSSDGKLTADADGGTGAYTYEWNTNPLATAAGTFTVVATDYNGCMDTTEITITEPPELSIEFSITNVDCYGRDNGSITAEVLGGTPIFPGFKYDYSWSNNFSEQVAISKAINLSPGIYSVTATDDNGCTIDSSDDTLLVRQPANPLTLNVDSTDETCDGADDGTAICIADGGTGTYTYEWTNGETANLIDALTPGVYTVTLTDDNGCEVTSSTVINGFRDVFLPGNLSMIDTTICLGESFFIDIQDKPGLIYEWENGSQQEDRLVAPTDLVNIYNLYITAPNCAPISVQAIINVSAVAINISTDNSSYEYTIHPVLSFNCDTTIVNGVLKLVCDTVSVNTVGIANGSNIELFSDNNNCDTYNWTWIDDSSATKSILVSPEKSGWYFIDVEEDGCLGFDSIYVIVSVNPFEAFTPGDDDFNDTWKIIGIEKYNNALVQVFNRWGAIVFETSGGQAYEPWDGTNNGKELPIGTYYYMIDLKDGLEPVSGPVTIIR